MPLSSQIRGHRGRWFKPVASPSILAPLVLGGLMCVPVLAQSERPLSTETANTLSWGSGEFELGLGTFRTRVERRRGQLWQLPQLAGRAGIGPTAELRIEGSGIVWFDPDDGGDRREPGDFTLWTKVRFWKGTPFQPVVAGRIGVKIPVTSNESGLGTDEVDFLVQVILSQRISRSDLHLNLGLAVLGDPDRKAAQNDAFNYSVGAVIPLTDKIKLLGEISGQQGQGSRFDRSFVRAGVRWQSGNTAWDAGLSAGLIDESEDWGIIAGMTRAFTWTPKEAIPQP